MTENFEIYSEHIGADLYVDDMEFLEEFSIRDAAQAYASGLIPKPSCQISIVVRDMDTDDERVLDSWIISVGPES